MRTVKVALPTELGVHDGLSYSLWLTDSTTRPPGGVVILHGAGSCKENHHDFARAALGAGLAAIAFDQRGHGESDGALDGRVAEDVAAMAGVLRSHLGPGAPIALRGSSMGGYLAIVAAEPARAQAVVAICPASAEGLRRGLNDETLGITAERPALEAFLASHELDGIVASLPAPMLLMHAEGDERVPVEQSHELARRMRATGSRLIVVPGGHHRSVQHDPELQAASLRWIAGVLAA
jgi:alpha-beta hydrolase superfamily lysophospholipase